MIFSLGQNYSATHSVGIGNENCALAFISVAEHDIIRKPLLCPLAKRLGALKIIFLFNVALRREKTVGERSVVGKYHKSDRISVKSAYRKKLHTAKLVREKLGNNGKLCILGCTNVSFRLIEHHVDVFIICNFPAAEYDSVRFSIYML